MVSRRDLAQKLDKLEGDDGPRETNWLEELKYAKHYNKHGADALTRREFFGREVSVPEWAMARATPSNEDGGDE